MAARRIPRTSQSLSSFSSATVYRHCSLWFVCSPWFFTPPLPSTPAVVALTGRREHHKGALRLLRRFWAAVALSAPFGVQCRAEGVLDRWQPDLVATHPILGGD